MATAADRERRAGKHPACPTREPAETRSEEEQERLNRQMTELLNELRVAMPGVQVLFAFLLAVPFQQGFDDQRPSSATSTSSTLLSAVVATAFLIAPSAYHRIVFQQKEKAASSSMGKRQFVCGLVALALAMTAPSCW